MSNGKEESASIKESVKMKNMITADPENLHHHHESKIL
jgi:hypothetical protein